MKNKSLRHISHYAILLILMVTGLIIAAVTGKSTVFHTIILISIAVAYFIWGIIHSALEGELHSEIVLEYLLFGLLLEAPVAVVAPTRYLLVGQAYDLGLHVTALLLAGIHDRVEIWDQKKWADYTKRIEKQADALAEKLGEIGVL